MERKDRRTKAKRAGMHLQFWIFIFNTKQFCHNHFTIHNVYSIKNEFQEEELNNNGGYHRMRSRGCSTKTGTRTGWPQHVWALELKQ